MAKVTLTHEINCDAERFWNLFFDKEFNEKLYKDTLGFPEFEIVEHRDDDKERYRKVKGKPKMNVPGPVAKLFGDNFKYEDQGKLDKKSGVFTFKITPSTMAEKLKNEGSVRIEAAGAGKVKRVVELIIEAKVFGVGGLIESSTEKQMRQGWEDSAAFMNKWIASHP